MQQPMKVDGDALIREFFNSYLNAITIKCFKTLFPEKEKGAIELKELYDETHNHFTPIFQQIAKGDITGGIELKKIIQASYEMLIRDIYDPKKVNWEEEKKAIENVIDESLEEKPESKIVSIN